MSKVEFSIEGFYDYFLNKLNEESYKDIGISYDKCLRIINVYIKDDNQEYSYLGRVTADGEFSAEKLFYDSIETTMKSEEELYEICIQNILTIAISDALCEISNMKKLLKMYTNNFDKEKMLYKFIIEFNERELYGEKEE